MSFLDKIGEKASEVYNTTAEKTNKLTREMKLKSMINDNNGKVVKVYQEIGEHVYENYKSKTKIDIEKDLAEQLYKIDSYQKEIEEYKSELRSLKGLKLCEKCSKEMNVTAKFCPFCGAKQIILVEPKEEQVKQNEVTDTSSLNNNTDIVSLSDNTDTVSLNDNTKREPQYIAGKSILEIDEPKIIVEEIGNNSENSNE